MKNSLGIQRTTPFVCQFIHLKRICQFQTIKFCYESNIAQEQSRIHHRSLILRYTAMDPPRRAYVRYLCVHAWGENESERKGEAVTLRNKKEKGQRIGEDARKMLVKWKSKEWRLGREMLLEMKEKGVGDAACDAVTGGNDWGGRLLILVEW